MNGNSPGRPRSRSLVEAGDVGRRVEVADLDPRAGLEALTALRLPLAAFARVRRHASRLADRILGLVLIRGSAAGRRPRPRAAHGDDQAPDRPRHAVPGARSASSSPRGPDEGWPAVTAVTLGDRDRDDPARDDGTDVDRVAGPRRTAAASPRPAPGARARASGSSSTSKRQPSTMTSRITLPRVGPRRIGPRVQAGPAGTAGAARRDGASTRTACAGSSHSIRAEPGPSGTGGRRVRARLDRAARPDDEDRLAIRLGGPAARRLGKAVDPSRSVRAPRGDPLVGSPRPPVDRLRAGVVVPAARGRSTTGRGRATRSLASGVAGCVAGRLPAAARLPARGPRRHGMPARPAARRAAGRPTPGSPVRPSGRPPSRSTASRRGMTRVTDHEPVERQRRLDAVDLGLVEGPARGGRSPPAGRPRGR